MELDQPGFTKDTRPNLFSNKSFGTEYKAAQKVLEIKDIHPASNTRYPAYAAPLEDARFVTDYRSKCELNIPSGSQFAVTRFLQHNANSIISQSRKRQAQRVNAGSAYDSSTSPPHVLIQSCTEYSCSVSPGTKGGIGLTRHEDVPFLFGTFAESGCTKKQQKPSLTQSQEGGRNSIRGVFTSST